MVCGVWTVVHTGAGPECVKEARESEAGRGGTIGLAVTELPCGLLDARTHMAAAPVMPVHGAWDSEGGKKNPRGYGGPAGPFMCTRSTRYFFVAFDMQATLPSVTVRM